MSSSASDKLKSLQGSETVVPARSPAKLPELPRYPLPSRGSNFLLIIPTENKAKKGVIKEYVEAHAPPGAKVFTETVSADSGVGEQPYSEAGALGACNRISSALEELHRGGRLNKLIQEQQIGTVIVGAIENFIQIQDVARPADHAISIMYNATTGESATGCSRGVTVDPEYVTRAAVHGFVDGNLNYGEVTVGKTLAAEFSGLDSADWHQVVAGVSRYTLLQEALESLNIPWW